MLGHFKSEYKNENIIENKEIINSIFIDFLESVLSKDLLTNKKEKVSVINFISEFNFRNEILEMMKDKNKNSLQASKRLWSKFMSSLERKKN